MKKGWEIKKLGEVCKVQRGLTYSGKDAVDYSENIVLRATNINLENSSLDFTELKYLRNDFHIQDKYRLKKGSLLICFSSGSKSHLGKVALVDDEYNYAFGGFIGQITPQQEVVSKYLFYSLISENYKQYISELTDGVNINNLKIKDLQKRIVSILDRAFEAIDKAKANAEQNLKNAKELFQSKLQAIFDNGKLKIDNGEWVEKKLGEIALDFSRGKSKHRPRNWNGLFNGKYPFIQTGDVRNANKYINNYSQTYNEIGLAQSKLWKKGTICITIAANIAETAILSFDSCFPDSIIGLLTNPQKANLDYTYYLLQYYKSYLQKLGKGSAQDNINLGTFEKETFPFPKSLETQEQIVAQLDKLQSETKKLEAIYQKKIEDLEELKKSVLQKAFNGELTTDFKQIMEQV